MSQITWRNIGNPNFAGGNRAIEAGNANLLGGIDRLANLGSSLESNQKQEQTAEALGRISQLDRSGLATAIQGRDFQGLGNVDQTAINKALRGRDKVIDTEEDAKYSRDELLQKRKDQPVLGAIELAMANKEYEKATSLSESLSTDAGRAKVKLGITQAGKADTKEKDEKDVRDKRIANENDADYMSNTIKGSESQLLDVMSQGGNVDNAIYDILQKARDRPSMDSTELSSLKSSLLGLTNPEFSKPAQEQLEQDTSIGIEGIQQEHDKLETDFSNLSAIASGGKVDATSEEEQVAMGNFMSELNESHGDSSWIPNFFKDDDEGGVDAKVGLEKLRQEGGYSVAEVRAAMKIHSQGKNEGWGDPDVYLGDIADTLKGWQGNKNIAKNAQLAVELTPPPKSNSTRDVIAYKQNVAEMQKSLRGPKGKDKLRRLLKAREAEVNRSRNSVKSKQSKLKSKLLADMRSSIINR